jgi:predicted RNA-binding Zn-ribbon protein involved in translation (DUF1610 family)
MTALYKNVLYEDGKDYFCPKCGVLLEVDEEQMADDYGSALWEGTLLLRLVVFWCDNCSDEIMLSDHSPI